MATQPPHTESRTAPDPEAAERFGQVNEQLLGAGRQASLTVLDAYETGLHTWADYADRFAASSQNTWVADAVRAQAAFTREATRVTTGAARDLLK